MTPWRRVLVIACAGAFLGAIALSLLTVLFYVLFARDALKDGQIGMVFMVTVPFGAMLGAVAGSSFALAVMGKAESAAWVCLVGGGLIVGLAIFFTYLFVTSTTNPWWRGPRGFLLGLIYPGWGAPFLWGLSEMVWGVLRLRRR